MNKTKKKTKQKRWKLVYLQWCYAFRFIQIHVVSIILFFLSVHQEHYKKKKVLFCSQKQRWRIVFISFVSLWTRVAVFYVSLTLRIFLHEFLTKLCDSFWINHQCTVEIWWNVAQLISMQFSLHILFTPHKSVEQIHKQTEKKYIYLCTSQRNTRYCFYFVSSANGKYSETRE